MVTGGVCQIARCCNYDVRFPHVLEPPQAPVLREISRPQVLAPGEQVTLSCQISRFYPKELSVTWYRRGRGESEFRCLNNLDTHKIVTPDPTAAPDRKSYSVTSQLRLTPVLPEDDGAEYRCSVEHQTLQEPEGKSTGPLELRARPQVSGIQVLPQWEPPEEVPFAVQIQNFYPRGIHLIEWSCDGAERWRDETPEINENPDLTFSATSVWRIPSRELNHPELRVRVFVQQSPRELLIKREIRAGDTGLLRPPKVSEISQPESVTAGEEITLSCRMVGHFPGELRVTWLRRDRGARAAVPLQGSAEYRIEPGAPHTQDGKSFQQETRLSFTPSVQRDQGAEYVCRVGHVALGTPLERRSRELQVTGRADSAPTKPSASENRSRDAEPASSPGAAAVTGPLVEERAGDTAPKGNAGGDGGAETKSENDTHKGTTTTQNDTAPATPAREQARDGADGPTPAKRGTTSDTSAREQARDGADGPTPAKRGTTSDTSAREQARDGADGPTPAKRGTTSDTSAKEQAGDNTADESTTSDTSAREQARDGAASPTPAKGGTSSYTSAKEQAGDNTADEDTTSDASAKEKAGDDADDEDTTSELAEGGPGGARPAIGVVGDRVASTTPVTKVAPDAVVSAPPAGGPEPNAEASATRGGDDADRAERVEEFGVDGTAGASPGSSEQTA
ncbi:nucleolar and coiled-body phosphoprotein 1-like isoform X2 [Mauremys mutica]|uniref:nucleolar and coiled-body phosphoprotein 1-like isoform X2 n=1 Tax=Mauremys mutica TaxID=74926 RepID=UPI001D162773|nr:nucleolar and coiled-body phosphoprotein 1-like isoform X2 [Mauremys mutica]